MSFAGLNWQTWTLALGQGQDQKSDPRALRSPALAKAIDVQFDEIDGLQTRYPFASSLIGADIFGGGSLADIRRVEPNGDELLCFTKDTLYSWNAQQAAWISRGTHLALKLSERSRFVTTGDQVTCDRAELDGLVVYAWMDDDELYCAASDKTTGAVIIAPIAMSGGDTVSRPRLVALTTKIMLLYSNSTSGKVDAVLIDPADPVASITPGNNTSITPGTHNDYYDVCRVAATDTVAVVNRLNPTTSYGVTTYTAAGVLTTATKARTCDGAIAVACTPDGLKLQVARGQGVTIKGDLLVTSTLADGLTAQAIGTVTFAVTINQITAAYKTTAVSGQFRCHVFWSRNEDDRTDEDFGVQTNWVDAGGTLGTQSDLVDHVGLASRAWCHDERIFVWTAFAAVSAAIDAASGDVQIGGFLQNSYFMYRDDGLLCGKAAAGVAGGYSASTGHLPGVESTGTNTYTWCGVERRRLNAGSAIAQNYSARAPRDITVEFDSNEARRVARLGQTLYIAGAEIMQYDGGGLYELGFHVCPHYMKLETAGSGGNLSAGLYAYKPAWRWDNARGERERSTSAITGQATTLASDTVTVTPFFALNVTHKTESPVALELWRTKVNPTDDAPFYLATDPDPSNGTGDNQYVVNIDTAMALAAFDENYSDDMLATKEGSPENGLALESLAPPAASIIYATDTRLFLAGVSGDPDRVWYSKQRGDGEIAAFNDALVVPVPPEGGDITAIWVQQDALVVAREHAIYVFPGQGFSNVGSADGSQNYGPARKVPGNVGCESQEAFAVTDRGAVFKSGKGWQLLDNGFNAHYIGAAFDDYDDEEVLAVHDMKSQHQIRALTAGRMLVFDTLVDPWRCAEWTVDDGVHACMWNGAHVYASATTVLQQQTTYTGLDYGFDIETAWIQFPDGCIKVDQFQVLGEYRSTHRLRIRCARDHWKDGEDVFFQDKTWTVSPTTVGARLKVKHSPSKRSVEALKIRLSARGAPAAAVAASASSVHGETDTYRFTATAVTAGAAANGNTIALVADGTGAGTWTDGTAATFHYEDAVTTVNDLIAAAAARYTITSADGTGAINRAQTLTLAGGADATDDTKPTGEAARLTSIQFELGFERGLNRQLPAAQKQ